MAGSREPLFCPKKSGTKLDSESFTFIGGNTRCRLYAEIDLSTRRVLVSRTLRIHFRSIEPYNLQHHQHQFACRSIAMAPDLPEVDRPFKRQRTEGLAPKSHHRLIVGIDYGTTYKGMLFSHSSIHPEALFDQTTSILRRLLLETQKVFRYIQSLIIE